MPICMVMIHPKHKNTASLTGAFLEHRKDPSALLFFGACIRLGTILGRFSINYFSGLGLRIRVRGSRLFFPVHA